MITQADRNAAAVLVRAGAPGLGNGNKAIAAEIVGKLHDDYLIVQAFAEHRIANTLEAKPVASEQVSVRIEPATAQTLMDWNVLHFTDEGWTIDLDIWRQAKPGITLDEARERYAEEMQRGF